MKKYLCLQRSMSSKRETPSPLSPAPSPEEMQKMYAAFTVWKEKFKSNLIDMGGKLTGNGKILTQAGVTDGPFIEAKEIIGGYMIIAAENYDQALQIARESPGLSGPGSSIEVREMAGP